VAKNYQPFLSSHAAETFFATSQVLENLLNGNVLLHSTKKETQTPQRKEKQHNPSMKPKKAQRGRDSKRLKVLQICYQIHSFLQHSLQYLGLVSHGKPLLLPLPTLSNCKHNKNSSEISRRRAQHQR